MENSLPIILITPGDPAGVGPEIVLKALDSPKLNRVCRPLVIGDAWALDQVARRVGFGGGIHPIGDRGEAIFGPGEIDVLDVRTEGIERILPGKAQVQGAVSAVTSVRTAVRLALREEGDALVTGPISKEALKLSRFPWIGHTEMFEDLTGSPKATTMFVTGRLRIFFATRHLSLVDAIALLKKPFLYQTILKVDELMKGLGFTEPRLAIAGLNPHAGDAGLFGREEIEEIEPAVGEAREAGVRIHGPIGADSVFHLCIQGAYDAVISLTHDQGHIAAKTYDFYKTVSVTLGLPFLRTSVDHGTAFDIAWTGKADPRSMKEAIRVAVDLLGKGRRLRNRKNA